MPNAEGIVSIPTVCGGCHNSCPMFVDVKDGEIIRARGAKGNKRTGGALCSKGIAAPQIAHDPRRVTYPMRRVEAGGSSRSAAERASAATARGHRAEPARFERISWDEAYTELAERIHTARAEHGPWSVSFIRGQACGWGFSYDMTQRLAHCLGVEVGMGASECFVPRAVAEGMTYGGMPSFADYENVDLMIFWGKQPAFSCAPALRKIYDAQEHGARLVCIDPLHFHLGAHADQFIQVEPGTDLALMLGMLHVITNEGLWDREFVNEFTNDPGLARLTAHLNGQNRPGIAYTPEWAEGICSVPAQTIRSLAREYATTKRASITSGHGLEGRVNVTQTTRALAVLRAITGHLDKPGCDLYTQKSPARNPEFTLIDRVVPGFEPDHPTMMFHVPPYNPEESRYPLLFGGQGLLSTPDALRMMHEGKVEVCIVQGANPVVTQPQPSVTTAAFEKIGFLAVIDPYISETAQLADLVLPAATYLERTEPEWFKSDSWYPELTLRQKTAQIGEARADTQIMLELGRALGFTEEFPTTDIDWYIDECLKPSGITYEQLLDAPHGLVYGEVIYEKHKLAAAQGRPAFRAPGGKVNVFSEVLDANGFDPLPNWEESSESPRSAPEVAKDFPFVVFTGRSGPMYVHEQRRTIPWLREMQPTGRAIVHPRTAGRLGLKDNALARISSPRGSIVMPVEVTPIVSESCIYVPGGWTDANYNELGIDEDLDPVSSQANYTMCLGKIERI